MNKQDQHRINIAYVYLSEAYDELVRVKGMDNTLAHMARKLGAMQDTLYEYITTPKHENIRR